MTTIDILESLQLAILTLPVYINFRAFFLCLKKQKLNIKKELIYAAFAVYAVGAASRVLLPYFRFFLPFETLFSIRESKRANLIPFKTIFLYTFGIDSRLAEGWNSFKLNFWVGHIILSVPMGIFMQLLSNTKKKIITCKKAATIAILTFTAVEIIQYPIGRVADIDDIIINTLGCMLGYWLYNVYEKHKESRTALVSNAA